MKKFLMLVVTLLLLLGTFYAGLRVYGAWNDEWSGYNASLLDYRCNIAVIPIQGDIVPYVGAYGEDLGVTPVVTPDDTLRLIRYAEADPLIKGMLLRVDSYGGSPASSEIIANAIKRSSLPSAAVIRDGGTSAAYLISSASRRIIASEFSNIGSIGITMSYLDYSKQNTDQGINYVELTSGKFKDAGSENRSLTLEEKGLFQRDLKFGLDHFINIVAKNRNIPVEDVTKLADGSSLPGKLALEHKLIDEIGDEESARAWFASEIGADINEIIFCE